MKSLGTLPGSASSLSWVRRLNLNGLPHSVRIMKTYQSLRGMPEVKGLAGPSLSGSVRVVSPRLQIQASNYRLLAMNCLDELWATLWYSGLLV